MQFDDVITGRRSIRGYKPEPVPKALIEEILALAMRSPSSMNTQPWNFYVLTGEPLDRIREGNTERNMAGVPHSREFRTGEAFEGQHRDRQVGVAKQLFAAMGIAREDKDARLDWVLSPNTRAVIVELGANDMLRGLSPSLTEQNLEAILTELQKRGLPVLLAGMIAAPILGSDYARVFNPIYQKLAEKYNAVYYPFFLEGVAADRSLNISDGIHPNRDGIAVIVKNISPSVEKLLARIK